MGKISDFNKSPYSNDYSEAKMFKKKLIENFFDRTLKNTSNIMKTLLD